MGLREYRAKRDFARTPEPSGDEGGAASRRAERRRTRERAFVVQKHAASHLHYDFRLELEGVLKSWSVPKGPSLDPDVKRLAMQTEDHPLSYADFEGVIPKGQYGGGTVIVWDRGRWIPLDPDPHAAYRAGRLRFRLEGGKLGGSFALVRKGKGDDERAWLLVKSHDDAARAGSDVAAERPESVVTGRTIEEVDRDRDRVWHSNRGERARVDVASIPGARAQKRAPARIAVPVPKPARTAPDGDDWLHEIELSGRRVLARVEDGRVRLYDAGAARREITTAHRPVVEAIEATRVTDAVFDGVLLDEGDVLFAFDLLRLDGYDLRKAPLEARKEALASALDGGSGDPHLRFARHVVGAGGAYVAKACELGARGVVSKRRDAPYGGTSTWRSVACAASPANGKNDRRGRAADADAGPLVVGGVRISHPERVMYPEEGLTKADVARYYEAVADRILPHVRGRPLTLVRCGAGLREGGMRGDCMFMKHGRAWGPSALRRVRIREKTKVGEYLVADDAAGVIALAQMDILEIHTWNVTTDDVDRPDRIVVDLDPGPKVSWQRVAAAARLVREHLAELGLESWLKTTGGVGLHVVAPLTPSAGWEECLAFTRALASRIAGDDPRHFTTAVAKAGRADKIYLDYLRNNRGNTSVAAFSTRAKPHATVSVPLAWEELDDPKVTSASFTVKSLPDHLDRQRRDPWEGYFRAKQKLDRAILRRLRAA